MTGIAAGGGLSARGMSSHGIGTGAKGQAVSGGGAHEPGQKPQPHGGDFGRDGALTRGQGFSQRDAFSPAKQAQKPQQAAAHQTHSSGAKPQQAALQKQQAQQPQKSAPPEAQKPQVQQNGATKAAQQSALQQMDRQQAVLQNMMQQQQFYHQDVLLQILMDMRKRFLEWVKELFQLMGQPATH